MTVGLTSLMFAAGMAAWAYGKLSRRVGQGNTRSALLASGLAGLAAFVFLYTFQRYVLNF